jgi:hypothetical protein
LRVEIELDPDGAGGGDLLEPEPERVAAEAQLPVDELDLLPRMSAAISRSYSSGDNRRAGTARTGGSPSSPAKPRQALASSS